MRTEGQLPTETQIFYTSAENQDICPEKKSLYLFFFFFGKACISTFFFLPVEFDPEILPHKAVSGSFWASLVLGVMHMGSHLSVQDRVLGQ